MSQQLSPGKNSILMELMAKNNNLMVLMCDCCDSRDTPP